MYKAGDRIKVNGPDRIYIGTVRTIMIYKGALSYVVLPDHEDRHDIIRDHQVIGTTGEIL